MIQCSSKDYKLFLNHLYTDKCLAPKLKCWLTKSMNEGISIIPLNI